MNAHQRRTHRRSTPAPTGCRRQSHSGTTSYPDLMCTDGYMSDMDADGDDPSVSRLPCRACNPDEYLAWKREQWEDEELPEGLERTNDGTLLFECLSCGRDTEWPAEVADFDINNSANLCGGSPRCCP